MQKIYALIIRILQCPMAIFGLITFTALFSLAAAFIAEGVFGLEPCIMCIYQRYPFAVGAVLGIIGLLKSTTGKTVQTLLVLSSITFLTNSIMAFYHTGIQQKWWNSAVEACTIPNLSADNSTQSMLENIMSAPGASCDEISWQDPILGLSMANYNVMLCLGLAALCLLSLLAYRKKLASAEQTAL